MQSALRHIWLCADDYGISRAVDAGIRELLAAGRINATSVMVATPSFNPSEASLLKLAAGANGAIGLHVTLTAPFMPLSSGFAPLRNGAFLPMRETLRASMLRRFSRERLTAEIAAQVRAFADAFGKTPDFIDGHQHVQLFPQIRDAVLRIATELAPDAWVRQCGRVTERTKRLRDRKALLLDILSVRFRRRARRFGIRTNPAFAGTYDFTPDANFAALFPAFLQGLPAESVVMCHPGFVDDELRRLDTLTTLRKREHDYLMSDAFPAVLAQNGIALTSPAS